MNAPKTATGMANTANMSAIAMTPTAAQHAKNVDEVNAAILKSSVPLDTEPAKDPNVKSYYHRFPGAGTNLADGTAITFNAYRLPNGQLVGVFRTSDPAAIAHLDAIVDKPGTQVFSRIEIPEDVAARNLADQVANTKGNASEV